MSEIKARFLTSLLPNGHLPLDARVEALLFVAEEPPTIAQLARALEVPPEAIEEALNLLQERLRERGLRLQRHRDCAAGLLVGLWGSGRTGPQGKARTSVDRPSTA